MTPLKKRARLAPAISNRNDDVIPPEETTSSTLMLGRHSLLQAWVEHDNISFHRFTSDEADQIRERLLIWYRLHRRKLPWRGDPPPWQGSTAKTKKKVNPSDNTNAAIDDALRRTYPLTPYGVWVSEIMLQQTRVEAVVVKWCQWMTSFPTVQALAAATPEQVNAHWAGLGFYRRARFLHAAAQHVVHEHDGQLPDTVEGWMLLPGVGRYTASAVCSIVYNVTVPVVDGNVCRVLARLRGISQTIKAPILKDVHGWDLAGQIVGSAQTTSSSTQYTAGEVNQALMELGATYCAPSGTGTDPNDPLRDFYYSVRIGSEFADFCQQQGGALTDLTDLLARATDEHSCPLCSSTGVAETLAQLNQLIKSSAQSPAEEDTSTRCGHAVFPLAPPKQHKREDVLTVVAISCGDAWLLVKRPNDGGLLAGQWEFPAALVWSSEASLVKRTDIIASAASKKGKREDMSEHVPFIAAATRRKAIRSFLTEMLSKESVSAIRFKAVGDGPIEHTFSHVRHTMWVDHATLDNISAFRDLEAESEQFRRAQWMNSADMDKVGVTSGFKKVLKAVIQERQKARNATP